jgi:potassium voltage-gated channel Eag-related subfamily H protein 7
MRKYDMIVMIALIYTTLVTPYEVAILKTAYNTRFIVNWVVDSVYIVDMLRSFFTAYEDPKTNSLIRSMHLIVRHYLRSWFIIDFVSIIPFDTLTLVLGESFSKMKAIKVIRLLRLLKLAKIFRSFALYDKYKAKLAIPLNVVSLFQNCVKMVVAAHWFACVWIMCATMQCDLDCMAENAPAGNSDPSVEPPISWLEGLQTSEGAHFGPYEIYQAGMYWAIATITSVGYGDITASNTIERLVASVCLMLGGLLWASIIGDICGIIATLDVNGIEFRQVYDQVNTMLTELQTPFDDQVEVRTYFFKAEMLRRMNEQVRRAAERAATRAAWCDWSTDDTADTRRDDATR